MKKQIKTDGFIIKQSYILSFVLISFFAFGGCAMKTEEAIPSNLSEETTNVARNDPIEPLNRFIFSLNMFVDTIAIEPIARSYRFAVPKPARNSVSNVLNNLKSPVYLANHLLQGDVKGSGKTLTRFTINSTLGIVGIFDVASKMGFPLVKRDFGETLAVWGSGEGFYLMLPLLGPSSLRDATGVAVDNFMDPFVWLANGSNDPNAKTYGYIRTGLKAIDAREKMLEPIDQIKRSSLDLYAATRTMYRQNRRQQINKTLNKTSSETNNASGYDFDFPTDEN